MKQFGAVFPTRMNSVANTQPARYRGLVYASWSCDGQTRLVSTGGCTYVDELATVVREQNTEFEVDEESA
jgi:hypothetical protein